MKLTLTPDLERLVQTKVAAGLYLSPTDVVREERRTWGQVLTLNF